MTTIAYRDGALAGDTQVTCGATIDGYDTKVFRRGRVLYGVTGDSGLCNAFRAWIEGGMSGEAPEMKAGDNDANGLVFPGGNRVVWRYGKVWASHVAPFFAYGSGSGLALGAMLAGATAEEAVRAAALRDVNTGGEITVVRA